MSATKFPVGDIALLAVPAGVGAVFVLDRVLTAGPGAEPFAIAVDLIAPAFFLWALFEGARLIVKARKGDRYGPAMVGGVRRAGAALMLGAFAAVIVAPAFHHLAANNFTAMTGVRFAYSMEALTLAAIGLLLLVLARVGAALKADLEAFV
jgi:hypothetical protein